MKKGQNIYGSWAELKRRCKDRKRVCFKDYWWRGITCCERWEKFENFYNDMWDSWKPWLQIDRIDNDWNYEKSNCRWVTRKENCRNKSNNRILEFNWMKKCIAEWAEYLWIKQSTLYQRYHTYKWSIEKCLTY
jgi:hypothetical protein